MTPPDAMTLDYIAGIADEDLAGAIYEYVLAVLGDQDDDPALVASLPEGLQAAYVLVLLDSEVRNGGYFQFFTNSSGRHADQAIQFLRLIGGERQSGIVSEAIRQNRQLEVQYRSYARRWESPQPRADDTELARFRDDVEIDFAPEFDRLSEAFYELEETDSFWPSFVRFVRNDPEKCVHEREPT